jgi:hypothetical protein
MSDVTKPESDVVLAALAGLRLDVRELERLGCLCDCLHGIVCPIHAEASRAETRLDELEDQVRRFARTGTEEEQRHDPAAHQYHL